MNNLSIKKLECDAAMTGKAFTVSDLLYTSLLYKLILLLIASNAFCVTISVDPAVTCQRFEGWGTSLCWWAVSAGGWNGENRRKLVDAIVDPDSGLGYTIFRYNIGGGDNPSHTHLQAGRAVPGYKPTESGDYRWDADKFQQAILLDIAARGKNCIFEAFSNSPPYWMTISGCASGNSGGTDNLKPEKFAAFADYLTTVVKYFKETHDITFRTLEPFNEPSSGYWKINGGQEGCGFKNNQSAMIVELGKQLEEKGLYPATTVSAADETSLSHTVASVKTYTDGALRYLSQINSHSYEGWGSRHAVDSIAQRCGKNLWQSESGPLGKKDQSDITMWMSNVIIQDLRVMKANAWIDWQVCDQHPDWRSIELDNAGQRFTYNKRFYMHAAFSRFIRPGSRIISSSDTNSVAAFDSSTGKLTVVVRNDAVKAKEYTITLAGKRDDGIIACLYRFTLPGSLVRLDDIPVDNGSVTFSGPAQSITTVVFSSPAASPNRQQIGTAKITTHGLSLSGGTLRISAPVRSSYRLTIYDCCGRQVFSRTVAASAPVHALNLAEYLHGYGIYVGEITGAGERVRVILSNFGP